MWRRRRRRFSVVVNLGGDALLEFGGTASIGTIASGATLNIDGTQAFVAAAGVGTASNSGLTGPHRRDR